MTVEEWFKKKEIEKEIPFIAIANDELSGVIKEFEICPHCGESHKVKYGDEILPDGTKKESKTLAYVNCGKSSFLIGLRGKKIKHSKFIDK